jgi:hypothetical protein
MSAPPLLRSRHAAGRRGVVLAALLLLAGCGMNRRPQRPAPGSDLARAERPVDRLVRGTLQGCDTVQISASAGSARDADPCRGAMRDTLARVTRDSVERVPKVP